MSDERVTGGGAADTAGDDPYYIVASAQPADERTRVLKQGDTFALFDRHGDIRQTGLGEEGLYHDGTRYLSSYVLTLGNVRPMLLSSTVREANDLLAVDLTNPDLCAGGRVVVPRSTVHLARAKFLWRAACYERIDIRNYGSASLDLAFRLRFEADFADIFEVRGTKRVRRGRLLDATVQRDSVLLAYEGLDGVVRRMRLTFTPAPQRLTAQEARFHVALGPQAEQALTITVACEPGAASAALAFDVAQRDAIAAERQTQDGGCTLTGSDELFNDWVNRAAADLHMMVTQTPHGPYPYAGVPWFSTPFGRDGLLTAFGCLWLDPALARGVLAYLAATQARENNPEQDAEPGKILHEARGGEMAALGEIPFGRYYGSVDATPLFVWLAGLYYTRTADRAFVETLWPHVEAALGWIDTRGDPDQDGFVEYARQSPAGLVQQGWKDSHDSIFHADGSSAPGPIALCEVQAYVYAARLAAAELAGVLGHTKRAEELARQAEALRQRFEAAFWCEDLSTYALALDGNKKPCQVRASNAGHALLAGLASPSRARRTAQTLLSPVSFSGWGVRTVAAGEARYNPMAYHNGSVWPHDNALIAAGFARYGLKEEVLQVLGGMFDASLSFDLHRLPELFCGFEKRPGEGPTRYPVACAPQAWAAAAVFLLLQASLGLTVSAVERRVCFSYPLLPPFLKEVQVRNLRVGDAAVDLLLQRHNYDVGIHVLRREGDLEVVMIK